MSWVISCREDSELWLFLSIFTYIFKSIEYILYKLVLFTIFYSYLGSIIYCSVYLKNNQWLNMLFFKVSNTNNDFSWEHNENLIALKSAITFSLQFFIFHFSFKNISSCEKGNSKKKTGLIIFRLTELMVYIMYIVWIFVSIIYIYIYIYIIYYIYIYIYIFLVIYIYIQPNTYIYVNIFNRKVNTKLSRFSFAHIQVLIYIYTYINPNNSTIELILSIGIFCLFSKNSWFPSFIHFFLCVKTLVN